jgi:hypothetical protein
MGRIKYWRTMGTYGTRGKNKGDSTFSQCSVIFLSKQFYFNLQCVIARIMTAGGFQIREIILSDLISTVTRNIHIAC